MSYESQTQIMNRQGFTKTFTDEFDTNQTGVSILTPTSGTKLSVKGVYIGTGATSGKIRLYFATAPDTVVTVYAADNTSYIPLFIEGARNEALKMTTSFGADTSYFVLVNYTEN